MLVVAVGCDAAGADAASFNAAAMVTECR